MRFLNRIGMTRTDEVEVGGVQRAAAGRAAQGGQPDPEARGRGPRRRRLPLGVVRGIKDGRRLEWRMRAACRRTRSTAPAAETWTRASRRRSSRKMMAAGEIAGPGVFVPEQIVPCERFFEEFARWGATVDAQMREILAAPEA